MAPPKEINRVFIWGSHWYEVIRWVQYCLLRGGRLRGCLLDSSRGFEAKIGHYSDVKDFHHAVTIGGYWLLTLIPMICMGFLIASLLKANGFEVQSFGADHSSSLILHRINFNRKRLGRNGNTYNLLDCHAGQPAMLPKVSLRILCWLTENLKKKPTVTKFSFF